MSKYTVTIKLYLYIFRTNGDIEPINILSHLFVQSPVACH